MMKAPYASTVKLYSMMATPGENKKIREYIEWLEGHVYDLERELNDLERDGRELARDLRDTQRELAEREF